MKNSCSKLNGNVVGVVIRRLHGLTDNIFFLHIASETGGTNASIMDSNCVLFSD